MSDFMNRIKFFRVYEFTGFSMPGGQPEQTKMLFKDRFCIDARIICPRINQADIQLSGFNQSINFSCMMGVYPHFQHWIFFSDHLVKGRKNIKIYAVNSADSYFCTDLFLFQPRRFFLEGDPLVADGNKFSPMVCQHNFFLAFIPYN